VRDGECVTWEKLRSQGCRTSHLIDGVNETTSDALHIDNVTTLDQLAHHNITENNMSSSSSSSSLSVDATPAVANHSCNLLNNPMNASDVQLKVVVEGKCLDDQSTDIEEYEITDVEESEDETVEVGVGLVKSIVQTEEQVKEHQEHQEEHQVELVAKNHGRKDEGSNEFWLGPRLISLLPQMLLDAKARRLLPVRQIPLNPYFQVCYACIVNV
jgi:hypothetical protein